MTYGNINDMASARIRAVMAAQNIPVAKVAEVWHQSIDMASRRINGAVELKLSEIEAFASNTGYKPIDFLADRFEIKMPALVPLKEATEMVGLCEKTLMKMAKEGKVKIKQPNGPHGKRLVKVASLQDFDAKAKHGI